GVDAEPRVEQPLLPALAVEREEDRLVGGVRNPLVADRLVDLHLGRRVLGAALATPEVALLGGREVDDVARSPQTPGRLRDGLHPADRPQVVLDTGPSGIHVLVSHSNLLGAPDPSLLPPIRPRTPQRVPSSASHQCARLPAHPSRRHDGHGPERGAAVSATRLTKTEGATVTSSNVHAAAAAPPRTTAGSGVPSRIAVVAIGAYAGAQLVAQVTSLKIGVVWDRAVDMGTFVYPITFTLRDVVHKVAGWSVARTLIVTCAG